jgi:hypothetical protein
LLRDYVISLPSIGPLALSCQMSDISCKAANLTILKRMGIMMWTD